MTSAAVRPPFADASPAQVRAALLPEEQADFDREWRAALAEAAESFSLDAVDRTLQAWRRIAWSTQTDPARHQRMLRAAAQRLTGEQIPADEPVEQTKARLGL